MFFEKDKTTSYKWKPCHEGNILAFIDPISKLKVYGGGKHRGVIFDRSLFIIDVGADFETSNNLIEVRGIHKTLENYGQITIEKGLIIDWRDGDDIALPKAFWLELIKEIRDTKRDVLVACQGGHGRTGTVLSILYALMTGDKNDPVKKIRESYCKEAVETVLQIEYIEIITGIEVKEDAGRFKDYYNNSLYGYYKGGD